MQRPFVLLVMLVCSLVAGAQQVYWVFFADKNGCSFDPYDYFDAKAIARYRQSGIDLYDTSNYPLSKDYVNQVLRLATSEVGQSRWMNALAVEATPSQAEAIGRLPFVLRCQPIAVGMTLTQAHEQDPTVALDEDLSLRKAALYGQLERMGGILFRHHGIDGRGIRIAVFDAGFPRVNTHTAFKHLHDNGQIVKTWNFPSRQENVYGWNSHGTMTLSCMAGIDSSHDGILMGLATGAQFLLARTEVAMEPFKEEVWWMQAVEWADQNGADIISSSLGYGKDRYFTHDMDGTSYVARAANMAARRGILVCNSAGNEGNDRSWRTIITPSDADSVLCVGGIEDSRHYRHIDFSSYGPTADGRLKPNVCAFGDVYAAGDKNDSDIQNVQGTSFSCPLVAGFAACAWQTCRHLSAMQLFKEIEHSADLYPYYDYAVGYGVPQASYFVDSQKVSSEPTFRFDEQQMRVVPLINKPSATLFWHLRRPDGTLIEYGSRIIYGLSETIGIYFSVSTSDTVMLAISLEGYSEAHRLIPRQSMTPISISIDVVNSDNEEIYHASPQKHQPSGWGNTSPRRYDIYWQAGAMLNSQSDEVSLRGFSPVNRLGGRLLYAFSKPYAIGLGAEWGMANYKLMPAQTNPLDNALFLNVNDLLKKKMRQGELSIELFQRIRLVPGGSFTHRGIYWDLGFYGSYNYYRYKITAKGSVSAAEEAVTTYHGLDFSDAYRWNYGVSTRLGYGFVGLYCRYRMTGLFSSEAASETMQPNGFYLYLPRLEMGLQVVF
ncbi:MAG: S8 family serine peptidase [Bacteroidales bacterium]|nr:S8 family serine peptidase [Bacteroidales bacterium]